MSDAFSLRITGLKEIDRKLISLGKKAAGKIVRPALRSSAKFMQKAEKSSVKSLVGGQMGALIARNIIIRALKKRRGTSAVRTLINPKADGLLHFSRGSSSDIGTKKQSTGKRYYIPSAIEYGHAYPGRGGGGSPPKDVPPKPAFRRAFDANWFPARRILEAQIILRLNNVVKRG